MSAESAEEIATIVERHHAVFDHVNVATALGRLRLHGAGDEDSLGAEDEEDEWGDRQLDKVPGAVRLLLDRCVGKINGLR
jgi:hypothetical protein